MPHGFKLGIATGAGLPTSPSQNNPGPGQSDVAKLAAVGAQCLRGGTGWNKLDSGKTGAFGTSNAEVRALSDLDLYIRDCNAANIEVILQISGVGGQPHMADGVVSGGPRAGDLYYEVYADLVIAVLDRYQTGNALGTAGADLVIVGVECGNETGGTDWDVHNYLNGPGDPYGKQRTDGTYPGNPSFVPGFGPDSIARMMTLIYAGKQAGYPNVIIGGVAAPAGSNGSATAGAGGTPKGFIGGAELTLGIYTWWNAHGYGSPNSGATQYPYDIWNSHRYTHPFTPSYAYAHAKSQGRGWPVGTTGTSTRDVGYKADGVTPNIDWSSYPNVFGALSQPNTGSEQIRFANGDGSSGPGPNKLHAVTEYGAPVAPDNQYHGDPTATPPIPDGGFGNPPEDWITIAQDALAWYAKEPGKCYFAYFTDYDNTRDKGRMWGLFLLDEVTPKPAIYDAFKALTTADPYVASVTPAFGPVGTAVSIVGLGFTGATTVSFGGTNQGTFTVVDDATITCNAPSTSGTVDVQVTTPNGTSVLNPPHESGGTTVGGDTFRYTIAGVPTVTGLSPTHGAAAGGTAVTITGTNFTGATAVKFGSTTASFTVTNSTHIAATSPAGSGIVRVKVTNAAGTSTALPPFDNYTYDVASSAPPWGINISASWTAATAIANRVRDLWVAAGSSAERVVRVQPEWNGAQSGATAFTGTTAGQNDTFDWSHFNPIIDAHAAAGNRILWVIGYTPDGLHGAGGDKVFPNRDAANGYRDVANYAWALVNHAELRSPGVTKAVEVWNEPSGGFLLPVSVANYTKMLVACYAAVKTGAITGRTTRTAYPNILVGTAGISPETPGTAKAADRWHQGIIDNGGGASFDFASHHPYGLQCPPTNTAAWNQRLHVLPQLRTVLDNAGRSSCPIWLTEDGVPNRPDTTPTNTGDTANCGTLGSNADPQNQEVTETEAATRIAEVAAWLSTNQATYKIGYEGWFELENLNDNTHAGDWADHMGIYAFSGSHSGAALTAIESAFEAALTTGATRSAPTCAITAPADDPTHATPLSGSATVVLINAGDTVDQPAGATTTALAVNLYRGNGTTLMPVPAGSTPTNGGNCNFNSSVGWNYILDTTTLADGNYVFAAVATNTAGLSTTSNQPNGIRVAINNGTGGIPTVTAVTNDATGNSSGNVAGGDAIHIAGTGFTGVTGAAGVKIGGTNVTSYVVVSDQSITAVTPAHLAGTVNTKVTNATGANTTTGTGDDFTYNDPGTGPTITSVFPASGYIAGGDPIIITGTGFTAATAVTFGATNATSYTVNSATQIVAVNPAHAVGGVDVAVTTAVGTSDISTADVFSYTNTQTGMVATVAAVTTAEGALYNAPNIPQPLTVDAVAQLVIQVTGGSAQQVDVYEGLEDPHGSNLLGSASRFGPLWRFSIDTTRLANSQHRIVMVPS